MIRTKTFLSILFSIITAGVFAQSINQNWSEQLNSELEVFKQCKDTGESDVNLCSKSIGESFNIVYKVKDFYSSDLGRYMTGTEIDKFLQTSSQWTKIGFAYDQANLTKAQEIANGKKAVLAVYIGEDNSGHVSIILPGELTASGSWGLKVPNSASLFMNSPQRSYVNKALSYAFTRNMIKDVVLYSRN
jgi:hypothetical protein